MKQRVLITGAADGIGLVTAKLFLDHGFRVLISDISSESIAKAIANNPKLEGIRCDVSDYTDVAEMFAYLDKNFGGLDVLINNAGIAGPTDAVENIDPMAWQKTLAVDLNGCFYCCRFAVPMMKTQKVGNIINISSTAGQFGYPYRSPYVAAKWALIGLTKTWAMELGPYGIRVNAICPGSVSGPRMSQVITAQASLQGCSEEQVHEQYCKQVSLRRFITAEDVANSILFLNSPAGHSISGQAISVDGHTESLA